MTASCKRPIRSGSRQIPGSGKPRDGPTVLALRPGNNPQHQRRRLSLRLHPREARNPAHADLRRVTRRPRQCRRSWRFRRDRGGRGRRVGSSLCPSSLAVTGGCGTLVQVRADVARHGAQVICEFAQRGQTGLLSKGGAGDRREERGARRGAVQHGEALPRRPGHRNGRGARPWRHATTE
jgi:hypothetical protein